MSSDPKPSTSEAPLPLWEILEQEFRALHGDALDLGDEYKKARDADIAQAKKELREAIQHRAGNPSREMTPAELDAKVEREIQYKPELINQPACRELFQRIHQFVEEKPGRLVRHSALCLSGGGIRSATFALGIMQGLAAKNSMRDFAYLSTVSGGGYIGGWLSSWIKRRGKSVAAVFSDLAKPEKPSESPAEQATTSTADIDPEEPFETEPAPIRHLRQYSNYLTPALGLLSGDGWAVAATVARNLLLNWFLIIPALLLVLLIPRVALSLELHPMGRNPAWGIACAAASFLCGVYALSNLIGRGGKGQKAVLWHCIFPIVLFSAFATLAWFWARQVSPSRYHGFFPDPRQSVAFYVGWGALTAILGMIIGTSIRNRNTPPPSPPLNGQKPDRQGRWADWWFRFGAVVLVFAFTGLATWVVNEKASGALASAMGQYPEIKRGAPAKIPDMKAWVQVDPQTSPVRYGIDLFFKGPPPRDPHRRILVMTASLCVCFAFPLLLTLIFLANTVLTGLLSRHMLDSDREWLARASGLAFLFALLSGALNFIVLFGPTALADLWESWPKLFSSVAGGSALLTIFGGKSEKTSASSQSDTTPGSKDGIIQLAVKFAVPIFIVVLLMLFSLITSLLLQKLSHSSNDWQVLEKSQFGYLLLAALLFFVIATISTRCVNINKFSLHSMYRNRLIRAYLGATNDQRNPNLFTGFDENDNLAMDELRGQRPFHILNTALNLVGGKDLAWQQRLAMSFTFTPFVSGSATLGYRDSEYYALGNHPRRIGITLGTAIAISGAAVSPNHGYNSSPLVAFILTFFNARLGGWFGNPGLAGASTWQRASPKRAMGAIVDEALGLTDADHPYVYLSDGGHFENLGLYEMVLRRCRVIVVSDAGCDPNYWFEDLGNAVSKIRVDFGIPIEFKPHINIRKLEPGDENSEKREGRHCAVGRIRYSVVDGPAPEGKDRDGYLIYLKPAMCGNEPMDVFHYSREHPDFPHEPTTDQWFTESQFESYRTLGLHCIDEICEKAAVVGLAALLEQAKAYVNGKSAEKPAKGRKPPTKRTASRTASMPTQAY